MQSVVNTLRVLEEVGTRQPVGVSELARSTQLPKTTVQRSLHALAAAGWVAAAGEVTRWQVTGKALYVGRHAAGELGLRDAAKPIMEELRQQTGETVHLMVPEGAMSVLIERLETPNPVKIVIPLGGSSPIHASANGKAVLAATVPDEVARILADGLSRYTDATIVDWQTLRAELDAIRERGYATNAGEWRADIAAVAAAIPDARGYPVASLSVSTPINRMPEERQAEFGKLVREAGERVGAALAATRQPELRVPAGE